MHPNSDAGNFCSYEFDPQADFKQFLKEAKNHAYEESFKAVPPHVGEITKADLRQEEKKKRKSWKSSLFSWLKMDRKNKTMVEPLDVSTTNPKGRRGGIFSGPIQQSSAAVSVGNRSRKPTSGPLPSLFNPSKREVDEIVPYMCLNQLENPHEAHSYGYGPVYLVT